MATAEPDKAAAPAANVRRPIRWYWRVLRLIAISYVAVLVFLYFAQRKLIFPGASTHGEAMSRVTPPAVAELLDLKTASGDTIKALFGPALDADGVPRHDAAQRPTILFCYGNAMCLRDSVQQFNDFRRLGANVIIAEYAGYGMSSGEASESGCYAAADAAYEHLLSRPDVDKSKIIVSGWSLGGAVAIEIAARPHSIGPAGLATFSTFTSMAGMGHNLYPFLPTFMISGILTHRFESEKKIGAITCPILIGHGTNDRIIPFTMADRLAAAAQAPVTRLSVEGADHNDFFMHDRKKVLDALSAFIEQVEQVGQAGHSRKAGEGSEPPDAPAK